jgi:hypothetical protein
VLSRSASVVLSWVVAILLVLTGCASSAAHRFVIDDEEGDASPAYLDIVEAVIEFTTGEVIAEITVAAPIPRQTRSATWQVQFFVSERQHAIVALLVNSEWEGYTIRTPARGEARTPMRGFEVPPPPGRTLRLTVPTELIEILDPAQILEIVVSTDGPEGAVDSASYVPFAG